MNDFSIKAKLAGVNIGQRFTYGFEHKTEYQIMAVYVTDEKSVATLIVGKRMHGK